MFTKTAEYYDALYQFKDYEQACNQLHLLIQQQAPQANNLLDVACGTGKHLEYLQHRYACTGLDLNSELLAVARTRCPNVPLQEADMTDFQLAETFDVVVCLFSSIGYVQTEENLRKAVTCLGQHLNSGGLLVIEPWITPENYWVDKLTVNFVDQPNLKIAWMYISQLRGLTSVFDINYLVGTPDGVSSFTESHVMGLWTDKQYREAIESVGVAVQYDTKGLFGRGMYYGIKA
ncbi:class I SAM-dependent methyltransferase (plasmid) [Hymenobacter tibetensis]|uniref:Class I SAM-dependent methyltransferase n=1 Tax=Hymenobacter tibetensis TaxID=497967 RepID=A0ABY4DC00_9BACT|nr:class I SAM-dependent methyltransferase [Hymenobacter tibetensis]UOG77603.1 class I SAM-dependent methyltransferase [Hymenobacter tibetensis]